jgi:hypothetical protein
MKKYSTNYASLWGIVFAFFLIDATIYVQAQNSCVVNITQSAPNLCAANAIVLNATSGFSSYVWSNGAITESMSVAVAGTYTVTVTNSDGCTATASTTIPNMPLIIQTLNVTNNNNYEEPNGLISINACGGQPPYQYALDGVVQGFNLFTDLSAGVYTIQVIDQNLTFVTTTATVITTDTEPPIITCPADVTVYVPEGQTTVPITLGVATATDNSGVFTITNNAPTLFPVGTSFVNYTATDAAGNVTNCTQTVNVVIQPCNLTLTTAVTPDNGTANGTASVLVAGGSGTYTYNWSNGGNTAINTGLTAGVYTVTVTDSNTFCSATGSTTVPCVITLLGYEDQDIKVPNGGNVTTNYVLQTGERFVVLESPCSPTSMGYKVVGIITTSSFIFNKIKGSTYKMYLIDDINASFFAINACITEDASGNSYSSSGQNITNKVKCKSRKITVGPKITLCANLPAPNQHSTNVGTLYIEGPDNAIYTLINTATIDTTVLTTGVFDITQWGESLHLLVTEPLTEYQYDTTFVLNPSVAFAANAGSDAVICMGATTTIGTPTVDGVTYQWSPSIGLSATNVAQPMANPIFTQTYTLTATNTYGCVATDQVTVIVNAAPTITANNNSPVCVGSTINLAASGGISYIWSGPNGYSSTQQNPSRSNATANKAGVYTLTVTDAFGCTATASTTVVVNSLPTAIITGASSFCAGSNITLTASGGVTYLWNNGSTSSTRTVTAAGTYTVTVTNAAACTAMASKTVSVNPSPSVNISNIVNAVCGIGGSMKVNISGGVSPYTRSWSNGATTATISNLSAGTYTVTVTSANGCTASASANIVNVLLVPPSGLSVTNITPTSAKLNWAAVAGASNYTIFARKVGTAAWTSITATGTSKTINSGLAPCKTYEWKVRANCAGVGSSSAFSAVAAFSTAGCAAKTDEGIADEINLVPNPANNLVIINYNSTQTQQLTIWVTDMMGKTVLQQTVTASEGDNEISLIIEQLQTGYYIVQLNNGTTKMRTKLLVVK